MNEITENGKSKILILKEKISMPYLNFDLIFVFSSQCVLLDSTNRLPRPQGSKNLDRAMQTIKNCANPKLSLIVSDGKPDDKRAALMSAKTYPGIINTLFIGRDDDTEAITFMRKLAMAGAGKNVNCDIRKVCNQTLLHENIKKLNPGS